MKEDPGSFFILLYDNPAGCALPSVALCYWQVLAPYNKEINVNERVKELYIDHLLPRVAARGDDNNYGSSAMYDVLALQVSDYFQNSCLSLWSLLKLFPLSNYFSAKVTCPFEIVMLNVFPKEQY